MARMGSPNTPRFETPVSQRSEGCRRSVLHASTVIFDGLACSQGAIHDANCASVRNALVEWEVPLVVNFPFEASAHDFGQRCVHAVRLEDPLRGRDHYLFVGQALRTDRAERLGKV